MLWQHVCLSPVLYCLLSTTLSVSMPFVFELEFSSEVRVERGCEVETIVLCTCASGCVWCLASRATQPSSSPPSSPSCRNGFEISSKPSVGHTSITEVPRPTVSPRLRVSSSRR